MKLVKRNDEDMVVSHEYKIEDRKITVHIKYVSEDEIRSYLKQSKIYNFSKGQRLEDIDDEKFRRKMLKRALINIEGLHRKDILYLIEPSLKIELDDGEAWDDEVVCNDEIKTLIIENTVAEFNTFLLGAARHAESLVLVNNAKEIENLKRGSRTRTPQRDKQTPN